MGRSRVRPYANAIWNALVNAILERWDDDLPSPITYGELRTKITGSSTGSQSTDHPLGYINTSIKSFNKQNKDSVPLLNALVVNGATLQAGKGIPETKSAKVIWSKLRKRGKGWLVRFGPEGLGFLASTEYKSKSRKVLVAVDLKGELGPDDEYSRSASWVIPKHHPAAKAVAEFLKDMRQATSLNSGKVKPDFFVNVAGERWVVEVKPDCTLQSTATAIGQVLIYSQLLNADRKVIAMPTVGSKIIASKEFESIAKANKIWILPLIKQRNSTFIVGTMWTMGQLEQDYRA